MGTINTHICVIVVINMQFKYFISLFKQRRGTARTLPNFCVVCIVCFVSFSVLFVCICVLYYCHRVATQLQLNISYHIGPVLFWGRRSRAEVS